MKRRVYLATAALALGGCSSTRNDADDDTDGDAGADDDTNDDDEPDPIEVTSGTFDDFEDGDEWEVPAGMAYFDESRSVIGSQSVRLESPTDDNRLSLSRTFDTLRDLSGVVPGIAVMASSRANPLIRLVDEDSNALEYRCASNPDAPFMRYNFGISSVVGEPDLGRIRTVEIVSWTDPDEESSLWIDDFHFVSRPDTGLVSIQFARGFESIGSEAYPVLDEYGYAGTVFAETDHIGGEGYLGLDELEALAANGWTIASQGRGGRNVPDLSSDEKREEIRDARIWLQARGFHDGASFVAYPLGNYDQETMGIVADNHDLAFTGGYPASGHIRNPLVCSYSASSDADEIIDMLDLTAEYGGITPLYYGDLADGGADAFRDAMAYLHDRESNGDLEVVSPGDILADYTGFE